MVREAKEVLSPIFRIRDDPKMTRTKAFTLVEFLLSVAVLAVLAAILFPVTVRAKQGAGQTSTILNLRLVGSAANLYANDYDTMVVRTQQSEFNIDKAWSVALAPYLTNRQSFFDPTREVPTGTTVLVAGVAQPWYRVTTLSINDAGYSGRMTNQGNTCAGRRIGYTLGQRSLAAMVSPNQRVAFAPTTYGGTTVGWSSFHSYDASWINTNASGATFNWNNMVYNTRTLYTNNVIPVVHADGSAGSLTRADFVDRTQAPNLTAYCAWMNSTGSKTWGAYWTGS